MAVIELLQVQTQLHKYAAHQTGHQTDHKIPRKAGEEWMIPLEYFARLEPSLE